MTGIALQNIISWRITFFVINFIDEKAFIQMLFALADRFHSAGE